MATVRRIAPRAPTLVAKKRVAAYARVSSETDRLNHSLSTQISYYNERIQRTPEWEYAGVYADCGISGATALARNEFQRMLQDCEAGKIDIILTKSISRFARNTVDLLQTVRRLKELGVEVRFEREKVNSLSESGELMLTLLASIAQEELASLSQNIRWGLRRRYSAGNIGMQSKRLLGYRYDEQQKQYVIVPEEAVIVRRIFQRYIEQVPLRDICDELNAEGLRTLNGCLFQEAAMSLLVKNEIYAGDIRRQKTFTIDHMTKKKVKNHGELPQYYMPDCHEAILDRDAWAKVQAEIARRTSLLNPTYCFTRKIRCELCGQLYSRKASVVKGRRYTHWICRAKKEVGMTCTSPNFGEEELQKICADVLGLEVFSEDAFMQNVKQMTVLKDGSIEFQLNGGKKKLWKNHHFTSTKHIPTMTEGFRDRIFCGVCGRAYHRVNAANRYVFWYCYGKKKKIAECANGNIPDFLLRNISAYMMGMDDFDEQAFVEQVECITAQPDGNLLYTFTDGRTSLWQK